MRLFRASPLGRLSATGPDEELCQRALELALELVPEGRVARAIAFGATPAWVKGGPLEGKARLRHGARGLAGLSLPREREYANLRWLAARLFRVPRPLAAAALYRRGLPAHQLLFTGLVEPAAPLHEALPDLGAAERDAVLTELAREAARLHALGFTHGDLYLRNLLLLPLCPPDEAGDARRLVLLDAWSRGPRRLGPTTRGAGRDLACLFLEASSLLSEPELEALLERYLAERAAQEAPVHRATLRATVRSEQRRLLARIAREPGRWRLNGSPKTWHLG